MDIETLNKKLKILCENIPKNQWRYFSKRTIENYINHVELIKGNLDRAKTITALSDYLKDVNENFEPTAEYSIAVFQKYLIQIKPLYRELGFALVPGMRLFWFLLIIIIIVAFILKQYFYFDIFYLSMVAIIFVRMLIKLYQNKAYGPGY